MPSVRETIVATIATALENLNLNNGESTPDAIVDQVLREYEAPEIVNDLPVIWVLDMRESKVTGSGGATLRHYMATLRLTILIVDTAGEEVRDEPMSVTANRMLAAVEKKLFDESVPDSGTIKQIPGVNWLHPVGNRTVPFGESSNLVMVSLDVEVQYLHRDTDPNVGRA